MESRRTVYEHGRQSDRTYLPTSAESCQGIDSDTLKLCGEGPDYCLPCAGTLCGKVVCEEHAVKIPGEEGVWCFPCAKRYFDIEDALDAEEMAVA